ncbi:hypothetical protein ABW636_20960 [Aquimarina sp. 2201CG1-2-11]|uniref:hypothetical protein n=1 Tax=Aquimarina discodermiae TaxID=3231043 RepID=UPI003461D57C
MMKIKYLICLFICSCSFHCIWSQGVNLARLEYAYIPQANDNEYSRFRIETNLPIPLKEKGSYLIVSADYRYNSLVLEDKMMLEDVEGLDSFQTAGLELGYTFKMKNNWRFGSKLGMKISSNFEDSGIKSDDLRYTGAIYFVKSYEYDEKPKMARLVMGVKYTTPASINFPLPILNYFKRFHTNWSFSVGTPKSNIKYYFNKKNTLQAFVGLDRFYANLQNNRSILVEGQGVQVAENISMLNIMGALGYEHYFTEHLLFFFYTGYTLSNEIRLRNADQNDILFINDENTGYFRGGIKFKI